MVESGENCSGWQNSDCLGTPLCPPRCPRFFDETGEPLIVRPVDDDLEVLHDLYGGFDSSERTMGIPPADESVLQSWLSRFLSDGINLVVADDERLLGHTGAVPSSDGPAKLVVFVRRAAQGRGIGTELTKQLVAYAADQGFSDLALDVLKENESAINVYQNVDFDITAKHQQTLEMYIDLDSSTAERVQQPPGRR